MSRSCVFIALLVIATIAVRAQEVPKFDLFGGYTFGYISIRSFPTGTTANLNGWDASLTYNWNRWFGMTAEGSGLYGSQQISPAVNVFFVCQPSSPTCPAVRAFGRTIERENTHTYSIGPRLSFPNPTRFTPFARALFGGGYTTDAGSSGSIGGFAQARGSSMWMTGFGVDVALSRHLALRTQADFQRNHFFNRSGQHFRFSTGLVWHFGRR